MKKENEYLRREVQSHSEMVNIRMERIFGLCDELKESEARYRKLQTKLGEVEDIVDKALHLDDVYGVMDQLREIEELLED